MGGSWKAEEGDTLLPGVVAHCVYSHVAVVLQNGTKIQERGGCLPSTLPTAVDITHHENNNN
jgi:hypothetical protein